MPEQRVPEQRVPEQRVPEQRVPAQRVPEQRVPEQRVPEQNVSEERVSEERVPEQRVPEQMVPEQRGPNQRLPKYWNVAISPDYFRRARIVYCIRARAAITAKVEQSAQRVNRHASRCTENECDVRICVGVIGLVECEYGEGCSKVTSFY